MMLPSSRRSPHVERELWTARKHGVPIIPLLVEGTSPNWIPDELITTEWIDISSADKYTTGLERLFEKLFAAYGIDLKLNHQSVMNELEQITLLIPDVRWIRLISADGLAHPVYRFDAAYLRRDMDIDLEEDRFGSMSVGALSICERLASEFSLGHAQFIAVSGDAGMHFLLPIGNGDEWFLSFVVQGHPIIEAVINYFRNRDFLAHVVPYLGR
jgi:predicted regulator of Ras-like GTPase activity (Roadblock/LC7/MglB family)